MSFLGSSAQLGIGLAVYLDDKFSQSSSRVSQAMNRLGMDADRLQQHLGNVEQFGAGLASVGDGINRGMLAGVKEFAGFEDVMNSVRVIAGNGIMGKEDAGFKALVEQSKTLGGTYGQLPEDIALAQLELAKAGKSIADIQAMTEAVVTLGAASETAIGGRNGTAVMMSDLMNAFGLGTDKATEFANILTSASNRSTIDVTDLYESMKYASSVAASMGIPFNEVAASIATLGNAGLKGSIGGVAYANAIRYMSTAVSEFASTKKQKTAFEMLGATTADFTDAKGNLVDMGQMLGVLSQKMQGWNNVNKQVILEGIFGVRGGKFMMTMLNSMKEGTNKYEEMLKMIKDDNLGNIAEKTARQKTDDMQGGIDKMMSAFSTAKIAIGGALAPVVNLFVGVVTRFLNWVTVMGDSNFGQWLIRAVAMFGVLGSIGGRLVAGAARFFMFMTTSSGTLTGGMRTGVLMATEISTILNVGAAKFAASMRATAASMSILNARGITTQPMGRAGGTPMLVGNGRMLGKSNFLTRMAGRIGGIGAVGKVARFIAPVMALFSKVGTFIKPVITFLARFGGMGSWILKIFGRAFGMLFGWPVMLADLALTLITGKGLFERVWDILKWGFDVLSDFFYNFKYYMSGSGIMDWFSRLGNSDHTASTPVLADPLNTKDNQFNSTYTQAVSPTNNKMAIQVNVHPSDPTKLFQKNYNLNQEQQFQSQIKV